MKYEDWYLLIVGLLVITGYALSWLFIKFMPPIKVILIK